MQPEEVQPEEGQPEEEQPEGQPEEEQPEEEQPEGQPEGQPRAGVLIVLLVLLQDHRRRVLAEVVVQIP